MASLALCALATSLWVGTSVRPPYAGAAGITPIPIGAIPSSPTNGHAGSYAWGAATMPDGSVIVGDYWNGRVLHYAIDGSPLGVLFSIAPPGGPITPNTTPYGLAVDQSTGVVYVGTYYLVPKIPSVIQRWAPDPVSGVYGQLTPISYSGFRYPSRVAVGNDGRIYVADMYANKIFVFGRDGSFRFGWASGTGDGQFNQPRGIALDQSSPQPALRRRRQQRPRGGVRQQLRPVPLPVQEPVEGQLCGLAIDPARSALYVVSISAQTVFKYDLNGNWLMNIGGVGGLDQTTCCGTPGGKFTNGGREVTVAGDGNIWVGDMPNFRVQVFSPAGAFLFARPSPAENPPNGGFNAPRGVGVDSSGNVIVADTYNHRIQKFDATGSWQWSVGLRGNATGYFLNYPGAVGTDPTGGSIVIADTLNNRIKKFSETGVLQWQVGGNAGSAQGYFNQPAGVGVGPDGKVYVADTRNKRIQVLNGSTGAFLSAFGSSNLGSPTGVTVDPSNRNVSVADPGKKAVLVFSAGGSFLRSISTIEMKRPYSVAVDDTRVYVTDRGKFKFFMFDKVDGVLLGSFGSSGGGANQFRDPQGIAYYGGKLYISDVQNDRISIWCVSSTC